MWIKRQEGYCLKKIAGVQYLLPYGQKVADQKKGIVLNDTGVFLWNELDEPMTQSVLAERLVEQYAQDNEEKLNDEIRDEIRQDVKQFVQELIALEILQECPEFERDENGCYPTNQVLAGYLKIAGMIIYLYGDRELISYQFDPFFFDTISYKSCKDKNSKQNVQQLDMQIELLQSVPHVHPNGQTLIRNEELEVNKTNEGYLVRFPSMNQIREAHMTADGRFVQVYVKGWDKEKAKEELFHAIRHFFLFFAQRQGFFAIHSASILYRDQVWIFSGHSGMGKSTHTNLWKEQFGTEIINGDLNLIGWNIGKQDSSGQNVNKLGSKGHPIVYGMPWCGTSGIASTKSYPLGGIVLLGRSDNDHFELLTNDQKIVRVMQRMISPVWKEEMLNQNLTCAEKLAKQIPIFYFLCTKEPSAAGRMKDAIDQIQSEGEYRIEE